MQWKEIRDQSLHFMIPLGFVMAVRLTGPRPWLFGIACFVVAMLREIRQMESTGDKTFGPKRKMEVLIIAAGGWFGGLAWELYP